MTVQSKRSLKIEKLARIYDEEIAPVWGTRFGKMLLRNLALPEKGQVLDISCGTGYPTIEILRRMRDGSRLIAIDASSAGMSSPALSSGGSTKLGACAGDGDATSDATPPGTIATCNASSPSVLDFACGRHPRRSAGTLSSRRRVVPASCSSSARSASMIGIRLHR